MAYDFALLSSEDFNSKEGVNKKMLLNGVNKNQYAIEGVNKKPICTLLKGSTKTNMLLKGSTKTNILLRGSTKNQYGIGFLLTPSVLKIHSSIKKFEVFTNNNGMKTVFTIYQYILLRPTVFHQYLLFV